MIGASATIESIGLEKAVSGNLTGLNVHFKCCVNGAKDQKIQMAAYFRDKDGKPLSDTDGKYCDTCKVIAVSSNVVSAYESCVWEKFVLFIPFDQLHLAAGHHEIIVMVRVYLEISGAWHSLVWMQVNCFVDIPVVTGPSASIESINWNIVTRSGCKGLKLNIKAHAKVKKGSKLSFSAYFYDENGLPICDRDQWDVHGKAVARTGDEYSDSDWNVCVSNTTVCHYDSTVWESFFLFIPLEHLHLDAGRHNIIAKIVISHRVSKSWHALTSLVSKGFIVIPPEFSNLQRSEDLKKQHMDKWDSINSGWELGNYFFSGKTVCPECNKRAAVQSSSHYVGEVTRNLRTFHNDDYGNRLSVPYQRWCDEQKEMIVYECERCLHEFGKLITRSIGP